MKSFMFGSAKMLVDTSRRYPNGRIAVVLMVGNGGGMEPFAVLSVNIPEVELEEGEFCVKTWSENAAVAAAARASGLFEDTGKRVLINHVEAEVWRFVGVP